MDEDLSYTELEYQVDELYFSVLSYTEDEEELFPISDEKYAIHLHFQEMLMSSVLHSASRQSPPAHHHELRLVPTSPLKRSIPEGGGPSSSGSSLVLCKICMEASPKSEMFESSKCSHMFCRECLRQYIGAKVRENISLVKCPELDCKGVLEPEFCQDLIPKVVFDRWESALCESMICGAKKLYCPFKDCSALMVDEEKENVQQSECPSCKRLFCAKCKVAWHSGLSCLEFGRLESDETKKDLLLIEMAKKKNWKRCPLCNFYVEKIDGCLHVTCRCKYEFCYGCGAKWSIIHLCENSRRSGRESGAGG